jgi:hypothetical protein
MTKLAAAGVATLDPYNFMAAIGKRVIHPGGRASTQAAGRVDRGDGSVRQAQLPW